MNKSFFTLICGILMYAATMTVQAQNGLSTDQGVFRHVALKDKDPEIRKLAIARSTDQDVFRHVALNDKDPEIRKLAIARSTERHVPTN